MLSIIIVNYNTKKMTKNCIKSIEKSTLCNYEIIVVDNSDKKDQKYNTADRKVRIIYTSNNGFGKACNKGAKIARGEYLLFLNPDTLIQNRTLDNCLNFLKTHRSIGAVGCKVTDANGKIDHSCKRSIPTVSSSIMYLTGLSRLFPNSRFFSKYHLTYIDENKIQSVGSLSGSFMMMSKKIFNKVCGFDERFFMYGEDIDLCCKIRRSGYSVVYYPYASIIHLKGECGFKSGNPEIIKAFYNSMILFYNKYYIDKYPDLLNFAVHLCIKLKAAIALFIAYYKN